MSRKSYLFKVLFLFLAFDAVSKENKGVVYFLEKKIMEQKISSKDVSAYITIEKNGKTHEVWKHHEKKMRIPASVTKILTAGTVLDKFSPTHEFLTQIYIDKSKRNKSLYKGNLYLKGGADPSFVSENMWFLVNEFKRTGIKKITGDLYVDDTIFDRDLFPQRGKGRVDRAYDAPIGGMSFNWNSVNVFVRNENGKPTVIVDPENTYIKLDANVKSGRKTDLNISRKRGKDHDRIVARGIFAKNADERVNYKNISNPSLWSGHQLKSFLKQRGITLLGKVKRKKMPTGFNLVAEAKSKPLALIVADLMKFSNNYVAEMLTKHLSIRDGKQGNLPEGVEVIRQFVRSSGAYQKGFHLENASGLTRENKVSAEQIGKFLNYLRSRFDLAPEFINSLPIAGVDGTLRRRMKNKTTKRWVRAKTGHLSGVTSLAGYAGRRDGVVLTFSFIYNGKNETRPNAQKLFDQWAKILIED